MSAAETIAEAYRRGIHLIVKGDHIQAGPPEKIDAEFDAQLAANASEIARIIQPNTTTPEPAPIVKIIPGNDFRSLLANTLLGRMGLETTHPHMNVQWFVCSEGGDVRVEIRALTRPRKEGWQ